MANQTYVDQTSVQPDGLSEHMTSRRSSMVQPHGTAYPELESPPYSVTTFGQQHQINETHLLTPVSGTGSPCVQQTASLPQYPSAMTAMQSQASPSGPSRVPWHNPVNMSATQSQVGSPMPINPPTSDSHFEMSYIPAENDDVPEPPTDYYWGNYTVSAQSEPEQGSLSPQMPPEYYMPHNGQHVMQPQPIMGQMPSELPMPQNAAPVHAPYYTQQNPAPWVEQADITHFKTTATRRRQFGYSLPSTQIARQEPIAQASGPSRPSRPQSVGRVARQPRMRGRTTPPSRESTEAVNIAQAQLEEVTPDLPDDFVIKEDCPQEQRFLFERQRELTAAGHKGRGMWELISAEFNAKFDVDSDIPRLQMLVARGRYKYLRMSPRDQHLAAKAYGFVCQQFHKMAAHKFKEFGGGQITPWGQSALECFAVDMGLVEECYVPMPNDPQVKTRRAKKVSNRLRSGAYSNAILQEAANNGGGVLERNPELRDQVMDEIFDYRGDDAEGEEEDEAMLDKIYQTRSKGSGRQGGIKLEGGQGVDAISGKVASTRKTSRSRRAPAKPRAKGRLAPKSKAS
ncbi:uncharacterized protein ColSpa_03410 [Colletotrichum spaethianum]|uniref:Uncharacterized protein n=1 Tax=Colletotrichum spaethianum TaxID=700344 RepID=A0AA37LAV9_9PEZI|nr:uncharacterized protein ColSpa_03410 [Colletotrichum spaethianum]GKT43229.1 hypothetical protein ColSpa_03410 [Colletotrichum spaethianum]